MARNCDNSSPGLPVDATSLRGLMGARVTFPTPLIYYLCYSVQLTLNDYHNFLLWNYSQVESFSLWSLRGGVRHALFRLMSDVDAGINDSRPQ